MRVTISHNKPVEQVKASVDRSMDQVFQGVGMGVVEFSDLHKEWHGSVMNFSVAAKMGFLKTPIKGTVDVTASDVTIDVDLGLLGKLVPQEAVRSGIEGRIRGLIAQ